MKKNNSKKGRVFWITGYSGSGKTEIAKKIEKFINKKFGKTLIISGDDLRDIFFLKKYDKKSRIKYALAYSKFCKLVSNQGINVVISTVSLFNQVRLWNKKNISKYTEIYIKSELSEIINFNKKREIYDVKKNIMGKNIKAQLPKKPNIFLKNDFSKTINQLSKDLIQKINKKY
jgi:adenylylsulfate kinase-like enzyme